MRTALVSNWMQCGGKEVMSNVVMPNTPEFQCGCRFDDSSYATHSTQVIVAS